VTGVPADASARVTGLLRAARDLGGATSSGDVLAAVALQVAGALGATATALCLPDPGTRLVRTLVATVEGDRVRIDVTDLAEDHPLPVVRAALTGRTWWLPDRAAAEQELPEAGDLYRTSRTEASALVPLLAGGRRAGALGLAFDEARPWTPADRELVEAVAALAAQALERITAVEAERSAVAKVHRVLDALRDSLVPAVPGVPGLDVAALSRPAAADVRLGGDWWDALPASGGTGEALLVALGDVVGHDGVAAVAVAQARGALRGALAASGGGSPGAALESLDAVLSAPDVDVMATAVLCRLQPADGGWLLRWSNAGHPAPLVRRPDGRVEVLDDGSDLLLGLQDETGRRDRTTLLAPGSTLLLFSDGLLERRGEDLDDRRAELAALLAARAGAAAAELCDAALDALAQDADDDVTVLALVTG